MKVKLPKLEPWQKDLFTLYEQNPKDKWIIVKSGRQRGKSICMEVLMVYVSLLQGGSFSLFVSPVILQARKVFQDVCKMASELIKSANASVLEIEFINGSVIKFGSAQQADSLRGFTVKGSGLLVIDEALAISDDVFYQILVPTTNVFHSDIFIISTPRQKQGFFFDLFMKGLEDNPKIMSVDWNNYDTSKYLPPETKELYRQQMPRLAFKSEILAEFIDGDSAVFGNYESCIEDTEIDYSKSVYIGVDWGTGSGGDNTAIAIGQLTDKRLEVKQIIAFNDKTVQETIDYIVSLTNRFTGNVTVVVEQNSIGKVYYQVLVNAITNPKCLCTLFVTTNKSKDKIIRQLCVCFEQNKITIPNDMKLKNELGVYECKPSPTGLPTYNAKQGFHDDRVMALAILTNKVYLEL